MILEITSLALSQAQKSIAAIAATAMAAKAVMLVANSSSPLPSPVSSAEKLRKDKSSSSGIKLEN